ncbi:3,4-dihydroxy-2-butanone-4-phosphate synthase [Saccharopolyspora sp. TS4A08]|uniref:3,4-dihydroxy-2-butanone-4-phosphate synthase n=1 Tax=Saccharopolyspora ipomoeae TaxID=3042027 RepID=A0ABT6PJQ2_9PSEU|nr:3,4-dihydroxy-2-butanone-4-phosphate synthase [Saccharopolyspora sp. TS4A08]MDI2028234.1 3,4-dihydroxy-2-butanone-4-phosphate synthase [Saccharopolyspora sp. TS4A08]
MSGIAEVVATAEHPRPDDVAGSSGPHRTDAVDDAISALRAGEPVVLVDDTGRHPCGELVFAASLATTAAVSFAVRHTSGLLQVALSRQDADRLELPPISRDRSTPGAPEYGVAVDTAESTGTGISAADRARTIALLGDPTTAAEAFARPGHVLTYRAHDEGVLGRLDAGEAALDLVRLAGAGTGAARACLVSDADPTAVQRLPEARAWAHRHGLVAVTTSAVLAHRLVRGDRRAAAFQLTIRGTDFDVVRWRRGTAEITALVLGDDVGEPPIIHDECLHCLFDPDACRCRAELTATLRSIAERGRGLVLYRHRIALPDITSSLAERLVP